MSYYFSKTVAYSFEQSIEKITSLLQDQGFGILTEIDVQATLKKKLDVDFNKYRILGACNPPFAYKALKAENKIGTMLPCNVIVQELDDGKVEVAAINPSLSMIAVQNKELEAIAVEISYKLQEALGKL